MPRSLTADDAMRALRKADPLFQFHSRRGKGSHRLIHHPVKKASFPIPYHKGRSLGKGFLLALIRRFDLPRDFFD